MDAPFQPFLFDPHSAHPQPVRPANGQGFECEEVCRLLDCTMMEVIELDEELILIIDENGKHATTPYLNLLATVLWHKYQPGAKGVDSVVGRAILCHTSQFE